MKVLPLLCCLQLSLCLWLSCCASMIMDRGYVDMTKPVHRMPSLLYLCVTVVSTTSRGRVCRLPIQPCINPESTEELLISEISC